jgi:hypothetical protein
MNQVVQEVEIAEALLASFQAAVGQANGAFFSLNPQVGSEQSAVIGSAEQTYPEVWRRLDAARAIAATSGRDLTYYDQIRAYVGTASEFGLQKVTTISAPLRSVGGLFENKRHIATPNADGIRAAHDAIATFKHVFADLAWNRQIEAVPELRSGRRVARLIGVLVIVALLALYLTLR